MLDVYGSEIGGDESWIFWALAALMFIGALVWGILAVLAIPLDIPSGRAWELALAGGITAGVFPLLGLFCCVAGLSQKSFSKHVRTTFSDKWDYRTREEISKGYVPSWRELWERQSEKKHILRGGN